MVDYTEMSLSRVATHLARKVGAKKEGQGFAYGRENNRSRYYRLPNGDQLRISDHTALIGSLSRNVAIDVVIDEGAAAITDRRADREIGLDCNAPAGCQADIYGNPMPDYRGFGWDGAAWTDAVIETVADFCGRK